MATLPLKVAIWSAAGTIFAGTAYVTAIVFAPAPEYRPSNAEREDKFEQLAPSYEKSSRQQEVYLGIGRMRKRMLKDHAKGVCLEVGAGTGHNIGLYPAETVDRVVMCDRAQSMVTAMRTKVALRHGYEPDPASAEWATSGPRLPPNATEHHKEEGGDASTSSSKRSKDPRDSDNTLVPYAMAACSTEQLPYPDNTFDTVIDVFGLCSFDQPTVALREMSRVCKPDGKLVLLEHGRGSWARINWYLDKWAPKHAASWGCWWNRDIRRYLRLSGLKTIDREERHFGTTMLITAKPWKPATGVNTSEGNRVAAERAPQQEIPSASAPQ